MSTASADCQLSPAELHHIICTLMQLGEEAQTFTVPQHSSEISHTQQPSLSKFFAKSQLLTQLLLNLNLESLVSTCDSDHTLMYVFSSFCSSLMLSLTCPLPCQVFIFFICTQQASCLCTHFNAHLFASLGTTQPQSTQPTST